MIVHRVVARQHEVDVDRGPVSTEQEGEGRGRKHGRFDGVDTRMVAASPSLEDSEDRGTLGTRGRDGVSRLARVHYTSSILCPGYPDIASLPELTLALGSGTRDGFDIRNGGTVGSGTDTISAITSSSLLTGTYPSVVHPPHEKRSSLGETLQRVRTTYDPTL